MSYTFTPTITLTGATITADWTGGTDPVALDFTSGWGRSDVLGRLETPPGSLTVFDPTGSWATVNDLVGRPVVLGWKVTYQNPAGPFTESAPFYRGRVAGVFIRRHTLRHPVTREKVRGSLVRLTLIHSLTDLANRTPADSWVGESLEQRRARLDTACANVIPGFGLNIRAAWGTPQVPPVVADDQVPLWEHVLALFDSCGADRASYFPVSQRVESVPRRDFADRGLAGLTRSADDLAGRGRAGTGAYLATRSVTATPPGSAPLPPGYLDADRVGYDGELIRDLESRITRVELDHPSGAPELGYATVTARMAVAGVDEAAVGVRTWKQTSIVANDASADAACAELTAMAFAEGSRWRLDDLEVSTRVHGPFETLQQGMHLLAGGESTWLLFLQRTQLPELGIRPVFGVMGGTIGYAAGSWEVTLRLTPAITSARQHPITWEEVDDGTTGNTLRWRDGTAADTFHETVTYEDMGFCATGLGVTTVPADQGWDRTTT